MGVLLLVSILLAGADLCISLVMTDSYAANSVWMSPGFSAVTILYSLILLLILQVQRWKAKQRSSQAFEPCTASSAALWIGWLLLVGWFGTFLAVFIIAMQSNADMKNNLDVSSAMRRRFWVNSGLEMALALLGMACMGGIIREGMKALGDPLEPPTGKAAKTYELDFVTSPSSRVVKVG